MTDNHGDLKITKYPFLKLVFCIFSGIIDHELIQKRFKFL